MPVYDGDKEFGYGILAAGATTGFIRLPRIDLGSNSEPQGTPATVSKGAPLVVDLTGKVWVWVAPTGDGEGVWRTISGVNGRDGIDGLSLRARGVWVTGTPYVVGDVVERGGNGYISVIEHESGTGNAPSGDGNSQWRIVVRKGDDGRSITGATYDNTTGILEITFSTGSPLTTGDIRGGVTNDLEALVERAETAADESETARGQAQGSATAASTCASAASQSASNAADSAATATSKAGEAAGSAETASTKAGEAAVSATAASTCANAAAGSAASAQAARTGAETAEDGAEAAETRINALLISKLDNPTNQSDAATDTYLRRNGTNANATSEWVVAGPGGGGTESEVIWQDDGGSDESVDIKFCSICTGVGQSPILKILTRAKGSEDAFVERGRITTCTIEGTRYGWNET